jgi:hypothetical protein
VEPEGASATAHSGPRTLTGRRKTIVLMLVLGLSALASVCLGAAVASTLAGSSEREPDFDRVEVFTFVDSGIVYIDPDTSDIIWRNRQLDSKKIGEAPWRNPEPTDPEVGPVRPWGENRLIVGNPDHSVVSWVESVDGERGDMVVVEAQTGEVLARAPIDGEPDASVVISSLDDEAVYYAVVERNWPFPDVDSKTIHVWRWAAGEEPQDGPRSSTVYFNDLSAGVSAIYIEQGVLFEDREARPLSSWHSYAGRTDFGGALSPDGRFWYGAETSRVTETATGVEIKLPTARERSYGWTGAAELTLTVCEPDTGACQMHTCEVGGAAAVLCAPGLRWAAAAEGSPTGVCLQYGLACGSRMPIF